MQWTWTSVTSRFRGAGPLSLRAWATDRDLQILCLLRVSLHGECWEEISASAHQERRNNLISSQSVLSWNYPLNSRKSKPGPHWMAAAIFKAGFPGKDLLSRRVVRPLWGPGVHWLTESEQRLRFLLLKHFWCSKEGMVKRQKGFGAEAGSAGK